MTSSKKNLQQSSTKQDLIIDLDMDISDLNSKDYDNIFSRVNSEYHKLANSLKEAHENFMSIKEKHCKAKNLLISLQEMYKEKNKLNPTDVSDENNVVCETSDDILINKNIPDDSNKNIKVTETKSTQEEKPKKNLNNDQKEVQKKTSNTNQKKQEPPKEIVKKASTTRAAPKATSSKEKPNVDPVKKTTETLHKNIDDEINEISNEHINDEIDESLDSSNDKEDIDNILEAEVEVEVTVEKETSKNVTPAKKNIKKETLKETKDIASKKTSEKDVPKETASKKTSKKDVSKETAPKKTSEKNVPKETASKKTSEKDVPKETVPKKAVEKNPSKRAKNVEKDVQETMNSLDDEILEDEIKIETESNVSALPSNKIIENKTKKNISKQQTKSETLPKDHADEEKNKKLPAKNQRKTRVA